MSLKRTWQETERQAMPWQSRPGTRRGSYNAAVAIGPPPKTGASISESSAPVST
jgi:hypothetical protein